jgi:cell division protease FtsH
MSNFGRNLALWVIIALLLVVLFNLFQPGTGQHGTSPMAYSDFISEVNSGHVRDVVIQGHTVTGQLSDGHGFQTYAPEDPNLFQRLTDKGVRVIAKPDDDGMSPLLRQLLGWFPMLLLIGVWVFFMRQMQSGGGRAMGFGKSRARMLTEKQGRITFEDVAGIDEAKTELQEIVEFLKDPQKFQRLGGKIPKGVQDASGPRHRRRGERTLLHHLRLRLRGNVRGRRRQPRARHVRAGQEERSLHHLHR